MGSNYNESDQSTLPQFGHYRTRECLGRSPSANTYLVENVDLRQLSRVIKQINPGLVRQDARYLQYFLQEAQMLAGLDHPHIVEILDYYADEAVAYIVMPYAKGGTLRKLLQDHGDSMTPQEVLPILTQIVEGLAHAHNQSDPTNQERKGILHLDLKPENILIEEIRTRTGWFRAESQAEKQRHYRIADFGIARWMNQKTGRPDGYSWFGAGTCGYRAPEQSLGGSGNTTVKSDIFSLGVMVHEMLSGKRPPTESGEKLRPLRELNKTISPQIEAVIQKATAPDLSQRYENVTGFLNSFQRAIGMSQSVGDSLNSSTPTRSLPPWRGGKKGGRTGLGRSLVDRIPPIALIGYALVVPLILLGVIIWAIVLNHPASAQPASLTRLGGLSFSSYCQTFGYDEVTADDKFCTTRIDLNAACRWSYPSQSGVIAENKDHTNSQTWNCKTSQGRYLGDISEMSGYCQYRYPHGVSQAIPRNNGTDEWLCEQKVNPTIVCTWQYNMINVQAHMAGDLWYCYGPS